MKRPRMRETLDIAGTEFEDVFIPEFAVFDSVKSSALDLLLYFEHFKVPLTIIDPFEYVKIIQSKGYFEDTFRNYFNGVSRAFNSLPVVL